MKVKIELEKYIQMYTFLKRIANVNMNTAKNTSLNMKQC